MRNLAERLGDSPSTVDRLKVNGSVSTTAIAMVKPGIAPAIRKAGSRHRMTCSRAYHCSSEKPLWMAFCPANPDVGIGPGYR